MPKITPMSRMLLVALSLTAILVTWQVISMSKRVLWKPGGGGHIKMFQGANCDRHESNNVTIGFTNNQGNFIAKAKDDADSPVAKSIFVSIAAFRDVEANATLHSLFLKAAIPERVFVGLICQADPEKPREICLPNFSWDEVCGTQPWCPTDNIRFRMFNSNYAKGPTFARHLASLLYRGEDYFMMIDSHNRFVSNWDEVVIAEHAKTNNPKAVLSTYPQAINEKDETKETSAIAYLCALGKNGGWTAGFPGPFWANTYSGARYPKPQPYLGAGLVFGPGQMVLDVPFDPHLPYLFFGEESLLGIRLWTSGYDLYSPSVNVLYHRYGRKGPRMETHGVKVSHYQHIAHQRIQHILGITKPGQPQQRLIDINTTNPDLATGLPKYGLGKERSLWQYWKFSRLDPVLQNHQSFTDHWCVTYGPGAGQPDDKWKELAVMHDRDPSEWWHNGVAVLAVPPNYGDEGNTNPIPAGCKDKYPTKCPDWALAGECTKNAAGMKQHCQKTCRLCDK